MTRHIDDPSVAPPFTHPIQSEPSSPFVEMREDFMFSEVILDGCLGSELSDKLLKIIELCSSGEGKVTLKTFSQGRFCVTLVRSVTRLGQWGRRAGWFDWSLTATGHFDKYT